MRGPSRGSLLRVLLKKTIKVARSQQGAKKLKMIQPMSSFKESQAPKQKNTSKKKKNLHRNHGVSSDGDPPLYLRGDRDTSHNTSHNTNGDTNRTMRPHAKTPARGDVQSDGKTDPVPSLPLCVDLDGTLINADVTQRMSWKFLCHFPQKIFHFLGWFMVGRAYVKSQLSSFVDLDITTLPYNAKLIDYIKMYPSTEVYLVTAADQSIAERIADHLGIFKDTFASDGRVNLRAQAKAQKLVSLFGERGFCYVGNSPDDLYVWAHAGLAIPVNASVGTEEKLQHMKVPVHRL